MGEGSAGSGYIRVAVLVVINVVFILGVSGCGESMPTSFWNSLSEKDPAVVEKTSGHPNAPMHVPGTVLEEKRGDIVGEKPTSHKFTGLRSDTLYYEDNEFWYFRGDCVNFYFDYLPNSDWLFEASTLSDPEKTEIDCNKWIFRDSYNRTIFLAKILDRCHLQVLYSERQPQLDTIIEICDNQYVHTKNRK